METTLTHAHADMRHAYCSGGAGIPASALGLSLAGAGFALGWLGASAFLVAVVGAALEITFALACLMQYRRWVRRGDTGSPALLRDAA